MNIYSNKVKRNCKFFNDEETCRKIQPECNCYQCAFVRCEIAEKDLKRCRCKLDEFDTIWKRQLGKDPEAVCSACGREAVYQIIDGKWEFENFCPHCGSEMKGENENARDFVQRETSR